MSLRGAHEARQATALARPQTPRGSAVSLHRLRPYRHGRAARFRARRRERPRTRRVRKGTARLRQGPEEVFYRSNDRIRRVFSARLSYPRAPGNSMREHSRRLSKEVGSAKSPASPDIFTITFKRTTAPWATYPQLLPADGAAAQGKANVRRTDLHRFSARSVRVHPRTRRRRGCRHTPSGDLLGVFGDRIDAAEAVLHPAFTLPG